MSEIVCPSGFSGRIRNYTVREEGMFADRKLVKQGGVQDKLLSACWEKTLDAGLYAFHDGKVNWDDVLVGDSTYALVRVRIETHGPLYQFKIQCQSEMCRHQIEWEEDLDKLPVRKLEKELREFFVRGNKIPVKLPKAGKMLRYRLPTGRDQKKILRMRNQHQGELSALQLYMRIVDIEGVHENDVFNFIGDLSGADADFLRDQFDTNDFGIETTLQIDCQECGLEMVMDLPLGDTFFSPSKAKRARAKQVLASRSEPETTKESAEEAPRT
jgi:hypothetical protein